MARFQEVTGSVSKYYLSGSSWIQYASRTAFSQTTALRFKTESNNPFYLSYRTYNKGKGWLPYVSSTNVNDYAGYPATDTRCVQSVGIRVIDSATGASLDGKYIAMYRAYANGKWQAWVSNAKPEFMYAVFNEFNLDGSLDTASGDAGAPGTEHLITRFELRVFKDNGVAEDDEGFTGGVVNSEKSILVGNTWTAFPDKITADHIDGIKLQTGAGKNYYLLYKTWNEGRNSYYPAVKSNENDYAGYPNKPIQKVNIQVCRNDGTTMGSGVIVMYRAYVDGVWQPWVSNADPEWMASTKAKLGLDGTLDTNGTYAGEEGKNIKGIDIRIYEDDSTDAGAGSFVGVEKALSLRYMVNAATNWVSFDKKTVAGQMDGIEIKTSGTGYYLLYKTWNAGKTSYYPAVKSTDNDYAGVAGRAIQRLNIKVYKNDGTQLTKDVVVMYRARVDGAWQPWVSNADPEWMVSVKEQFNLEGSLDTAGGYAGAEGKNIQGIEVRLFEGSTVALPEEELPGTEATATTSYLKNGAWTVFDKKVEMTGIDGIKIQTSTSKSYYLAYKTQNEGQSSFYPIVTSRQNDYAGASGKPIQKLCIHVYKNDGTKLATGVVVMYRARVDGAWLPWVSNANPEWMQAVQVKYALGGRLDTESAYAGISGKNIEGIEIRIFEENTSTTVPVGNYKIIPNVPFISQIGTYPTGCESVSTVMALQHAGVSMSVDTFIDTYLDKKAFPFDPYEAFGGNPREASGFGCYGTVIKKALDKFLSGHGYKARLLNKFSLTDLCSQYIDNNIPVILWATMDMKTPYVSRTWTYNGTTISWIAPEHCLLLVGYDDNHYIFKDPLKNTDLTFYSKEAVEVAYKGLYEQAIVIFEETDGDELLNPPSNYVQPEIPSVEGKIAILELINDLRELESICKEYYDAKIVQGGNNPPVGLGNIVLGMTNILRSQEYNDLQWDATTGNAIDYPLIIEIQNNHEALWGKIYPFIKKGRSTISDGKKGSIDLAHLAATLESYLTDTVIPDFWTGWGGDLATGMADTTVNIEFHTGEGDDYEGKSVQEIANATIGKESSSCNYTDFCSDFDAYKIAQKVKEQYSVLGAKEHLLSETLQWYYTYYQEVLFKKRFEWVVEELKCLNTLQAIKDTVYEWMKGGLAGDLLLWLKGNIPEEEVIQACCTAFASYIYTMIS